MRCFTGLALQQRWQGVAQQVSGRRAQFAVQAQRRVVALDRNLLLGNDGARVGALDHAVQGHAGLGFAVDQHPVGRCATTIAWQQRTVQVERAFARRGQQLLAQQVAVVEGENVVGVELGDALDPQRVVGIFRCMHGDAVAGAQLRDGAVERVLLRIVGVGEHRRDLETGGEQGFDAGAANIVIGEDNSFCAHEGTWSEEVEVRPSTVTTQAGAAGWLRSTFSMKKRGRARTSLYMRPRYSPSRPMPMN
ncbi:hypothetical protein D3C85_683420 [compost metagenome]